MFGMDFIKAGEVKEVDEKSAKELLKQPNVEEFIDKEEAKALEKENAKLKKELEQAKKQSPKKTTTRKRTK